MAVRGQLLERAVIIPRGPHCLDGIFLRGKLGALLIAPPLPWEGGSMASPLSNELAYAAARSGCASLRLDYMGVGASEGERPETLSQTAMDLSEGVTFLIESADVAHVAVAGCNSGAWAALQLAKEDPRVDRLLLVAPDLASRPSDTPSLGEVGIPILLVAAGDEPDFNLSDFADLTDSAPRARLEVVNTRRHFRSEIIRLARLVPPFLGVVDVEREGERGREDGRRGRLF
ncbi:MAG: alpha/beta hydrolase [Planctomycetes bacterium]|nr:alpha/beta hydrolase [Planctomycetota bacterium]